MEAAATRSRRGPVALVATVAVVAVAFLVAVAPWATDDFGYRAMTDRTSVADLHATILHQLGLDAQKLVFPHNGREERLIDVYPAKPIQPLIS